MGGLTDSSDSFLSARAAARYADSTVMVTGAGGSIGQALCARLALLRARRILLLEQNEFALFEVERQLKALCGAADVVPVLGSVTDARLVGRALCEFEVDAVFHTAAYKHVAMVEANPLAGLLNNVLGTQTLAEQACRAGVKTLVHCSTDKAVWPAGAMGVSKYLAEEVIKDLAKRTEETRFAILRFGNVWGSSGSVVPLLREEIARREPLTLTDPAATRFFLSATEATDLLLEVGAIAQRGEVFVPQMGAALPILQVALSLAADLAPEWEPEIQFTGLRQGEKLTEVLSRTDHLQGTEHPGLLRAHEDSLSIQKLSLMLRHIREARLARSDEMVRDLVASLVQTEPTGGDVTRIKQFS